MKEAIVSKGPKVTIRDTEVPKAGPHQLVIKVIVSGSNPKDCNNQTDIFRKLPEWVGTEANEGDDIAGTVHEIGKDVTGFTIGDRVTAFHEMRTPGGSYAEYAVAWDHTTIHIPSHITFEQASTLPLAVLTAAVGLYETRNLGLNNPWDPATKETPLVVYGGASAVGAYAIQFAKKSNIHPIITVAGRGIPFVEGIIGRSKGDTIVDYRDGDEAVVNGIKKALGGKKLFYAYDAISEKGSYINISKVIEKGGRIALVLPGKDIPSDIYYNNASVGDVHKEEYKDFGRVHFLNVKQGLEDGWLKPHPHVVVEGGLAGIEKALTDLKEGKASATKYVFRIRDTPGLKSSL